MELLLSKKYPSGKIVFPKTFYCPEKAFSAQKMFFRPKGAFSLQKIDFLPRGAFHKCLNDQKAFQKYFFGR